MAGRPRTPEGDKIRADILIMLRRAELGYLPKPSLMEIGAAIDRAHPTVSGYLQSMRREGLVTWVARQPRTLSLTDKGREQADQLLPAT